MCVVVLRKHIELRRQTSMVAATGPPAPSAGSAGLPYLDRFEEVPSAEAPIAQTAGRSDRAQSTSRGQGHGTTWDSRRCRGVEG